MNALKENPFNNIKNQEFELITSHHFKNLISPKPAWDIQWSLVNSFEKFKVIASLPILFAHISDFFKKKDFSENLVTLDMGIFFPK